MATKQIPEEDEFGFEQQPAGPDPTNTGLALDGSPNPPLPTATPDMIDRVDWPPTGEGMPVDPYGTDGTGSTASPEADRPPEVTGTDQPDDTGSSAGDDFGFDVATDEPGSGGANQTSAYFPPPSVDVAMPEFPVPSAGNRDRMGLNEDLSRYAADFMSSPTRYDMDVVQASVDAIGNRMARVRQNTANDVAAFLANRGILGTTAGGELYSDQMMALSEQEQSQLAALRREQATTAGQDRAMAGQFGLDTAKFGETQYQFDVDTQLRNRALELEKYGIDTNKAIAMATLEQRAQQFGADYALRERALDLEAEGMDRDQAYREATLELERMKVDQDEQYRRDVFGFDQDERQREWEWRYANEGVNSGFDFADWDTNKDGKWNFGEMAPGGDEYQDYLNRYNSYGRR